MISKAHRSVRHVIAILVLAASLSAGYFGRDIPMAVQMQMTEPLFVMAAVILGVMGSWLAMVYPGALSKLKTPGRLDDVDDADIVRHILRPLHYSTVLLCIVFLLRVAYPVANEFDLIVRHYRIVRCVSFGLIFFLTFVQLWSLLMTIFPIEYHADKITAAMLRKKRYNRMRDDYGLN